MDNSDIFTFVLPMLCLLVALGMLLGGLIVSTASERHIKRADRAEQQLRQVQAVYARGTQLSGALDEAALHAHRKMLRAAVKSQQQR